MENLNILTLIMKMVKIMTRIGYIDKGLKTNADDRKRTWTNSKINRSKAIKKLGGECVNCGEKNPLVLQINHLTGRIGYHYTHGIVMSVIRGRLTEKEVDIRCANCNILYEYELGHRFDWSDIYKRTQSFI